MPPLQQRDNELEVLTKIRRETAEGFGEAVLIKNDDDTLEAYRRSLNNYITISIKQRSQSEFLRK